MARVELNKTKLTKIMLHSDETRQAMIKKAEHIKDEAKAVFEAHDRHSDDVDTYINSFYVDYRQGKVVVGNHARTAFWVEFGAHIHPHGNKNIPAISVLGYRPLRTAVDIVSSYN